MKWTELDIKLLEANYSIATWEILDRIFKPRSRKSIKEKAKSLGLKRENFTIKGGSYQNYYLCGIHGKIYISQVTLINGKAICPMEGCNRLLRTLPRRSSLRRKYREMEKK